MPLMRRNVTIRRSRAAGFARILGGLALPVLVLGVVGVRFGIVPQIALQPVLVTGFALGIIALGCSLFSLVDIWVSGAEGAGTALVGMFYASPALAILGVVAAAAIAYPRLSDISTDVDNPPRFVVAAPAHQALTADELTRQETGYPQIVPRQYPLPLGDVYVAARRVVDGSKWVVTRELRPDILPMASSRTNEAPPQVEDAELMQALAAKSVMTQSRGGMATETLPTTALNDTGEAPAPEPEVVPEPPGAVIEATAPTPIFGFLDDVVIRLRVNDDGSTQVDMRSASRTGAHDLGQNARRIKSFFTKLDAILQPEPGAAGAS